MPITPLHLGPGLFFGMILVKYINLFAFLFGSIVLDIEPLSVVLYNINYAYRSYPHHGFIHTILGAFLVSLLLALLLKEFQQKIKKLLSKFPSLNLAQIWKEGSGFLKIFLSVFLGTLTHLIFDSFMHYDVFPFWPSKFNPLLKLLSNQQIYFACIMSGILGIVLLVLHLKRKKQKNT